MQDPKEYKVQAGTTELCVYEWAGEGDTVLLFHATGFHSRCWDEVIKRLPGQHVIAVDIHLHGKSSKANTFDWKLFADEMCLLIQQLELNNIVGVGHSMGGHLMCRAAAATPHLFTQLVLVDPVIMSRSQYTHMRADQQEVNVADHPVARRKNNWRDADEMFQRFEERSPFNSWKRECLRDYCDHALESQATNGFKQLACLPISEASFYLSSTGGETVLDCLPLITMPVSVLRAPGTEVFSGDFSSSPTWPGLAKAMPLCRDVYLPDNNHFIPMQNPELVASYIQEALNNTWQDNHQPQN